MLECTRGIYRWKQHRVKADDASDHEDSDNAPHAQNLYLRIGKNRHMTQVFLLLTGAIGGLADEVAEFLGCFEKYNMLWTAPQGDEAAMAGLTPTHESQMEEQVDLEKVEEQIKFYFNMEKDISELPHKHVIGSIVLDLDKVLIRCARHWVWCHYWAGLAWVALGLVSRR